MALNRAQLRKVRRWLASRLDEHVCPACGGDEWTIGDEVLLTHVKDESLAEPAVAVVCAHCARIELFDAVAMGLYER